MAKIKCRYNVPYCEFCDRHVQKYHDEYWWCDSNDGCDIGEYTRPYKLEDTRVRNPTCEYCRYTYGEFEKNVKSYEYDNRGLTIGKAYYDNATIEYLEVDGRVLVGEKMEGKT